MYITYSNWMEGPRRVPDGCTMFAVGDVHGHADELQSLQFAISHEIAKRPDTVGHVIYLGDYIDRGPEPRRVLEILAAGIGIPTHEVFLVGNHDQFLIELLNLDPNLDRYFIMNWYENGGDITMQNLDVCGYGRLLDHGDLPELRDRTAKALGPVLLDFLDRLQPIHQIGDYVFVHAGIDPARGLEDQDFVDLLLIREPFLSSAESWPHSFCVVHGHSIAPPAVYSHRIGVDAGCYTTGALCAVQLLGDQVRFIAVTREKSSSWLDRLELPAKSWSWSTPKPMGITA